MSIRSSIRKSLVERAPNVQKRTYEIEATPEVLDRLDKFLAHVQRCAGVGHSTKVGMFIDGDGPESFYVNSPDIKHLAKEGNAENRKGDFEEMT